ncbi:uncharacterized protein DUF2510 [Propionicimonas paludicola]|uniref:Uncharacterized protein DUF2510 n=1 Tax=Propionicimonas paludicola TaxID=185243 RepID=A0A2A9CS71_9ACTN|nr:DUF4328 domain-containing protein [Propionicimonas paludicola]PFG17283.1 uncharacterized protein DUF2510 [Propionicimonas paludicola]
MTTAPPTPAGWYPDPEAAGQLRYWDGRNWTSQVHASGLAPSASTSPAAWVPRRSLPLGLAIQVLLGAAGLLSLFNAGVEIWGFRLIADGVWDPLSIDLAVYQRYDQLHGIGSVLGSLSVVATGVTWIIWQAGLAAQAPEVALRRGLGWHIAGWFVPVVSLWFPVQNLADLRGALDGARAPSRVAPGYWVWWLFWLGGNLLGLIATRLPVPEQSLSSLADVTALLAVSDLLSVVAAGLAILVVRDLSGGVRAALQPR